MRSANEVALRKQQAKAEERVQMWSIKQSNIERAVTLSQDEDKIGHGVVVASVQGIEGVNEEVDQGASGGDRAVHLPSLANGHLSLLGLLHLLCNVHGSALCLLQILNQGNVLQDVSLHNLRGCQT